MKKHVWKQLADAYRREELSLEELETFAESAPLSEDEIDSIVARREVDTNQQITIARFQPIDICYVCGRDLNVRNRAKCDDGSHRNDAFGNPWCMDCTDRHDSIDWCEVDRK